MDLWSLLARLGQRKIALACVMLAAIALGVVGWATSTPSYSLTAGQALRSTQRNGSESVTSSGSFELGILGSMIVQNAEAASFPGATVTSTNAMVSPPAALPLVTTTATAESAEAAKSALAASRALNHEFLDEVVASKHSAATVSLVDLPYEEEPAVSSRPRIRSAGIGVIFGGFAGLTGLLIWDTLVRRRARNKREAAQPLPHAP